MTTARTYGLKQCAYCPTEFEAKRVNMIYCSNECCRAATNAKLIAKYHSNKLAANTERFCKDCGCKLSKYNKDAACHPCQNRAESSKRKEMLAKLGIEYVDDEIK